MVDSKTIRQIFDAELGKSRTNMAAFQELLDGIVEEKGNGLGQKKLLATFQSNRRMADYAVLLLNQAHESLGTAKPDLEEVREILRLGIETIQLQRMAFTQASNAGFEVVEKKASVRGKAAANARHDMAGGSRSKSEELKSLWASGKFTSRDRCAEDECRAVGLSYSAARKALIGTPDPT